MQEESCRGKLIRTPPGGTLSLLGNYLGQSLWYYAAGVLQMEQNGEPVANLSWFVVRHVSISPQNLHSQIQRIPHLHPASRRPIPTLALKMVYEGFVLIRSSGSFIAAGIVGCE